MEDNPRTARRELTIRDLICLAAVVVAGVAVKLASFRNFRNPEGGFFFDNPDSYDHLRHIMLGIRNFPSIALYDTYAGYPAGTGHLWAPLYDYLFATVGYLLGLGETGIETLCFFSGPFLFAVGGVLLFVVARGLFGSIPGALAAVTVFTFHPALVSHSLPSNFDHHVLELIICILFIALPLFEESSRFSPPRLVAVAILLVAALFLWRGATLFWLLSFGAVAFRALLERDRLLALSYAKVFLLSSLALALYCGLDPLGLSRGVSFILISWFQPILLAGCAAALAVAALVPRRRILFVIAPATLLGGALLAFAPPAALLSRLRETVQFMFGFGDPWLSSIDELGGTFTTHGFLDAVIYLTPGYFLVPVALILALVTWRRRREGNASLLHFVAWSPLAALAVVYRYAPYSAIAVALATAFLISRIGGRPGTRRGWIYGALLPAVILAPSLRISGEAMRNAPTPEIRRGLFGPRGTLTWIRDNTPVTAHYLNPTSLPEYGILADWDLGSFISYGARRPAVATPFGWEAHGFFEQAAFFAAPSQEKALEIAAANRVRYVLVSAKRNPDLYHATASSGERRRMLPPGTVARRFSPVDSMYYRLFFQDGGSYRFPDGYRRAAGAFRLVHESDLAGGASVAGVPPGWYKLFEIVKGARITGKASPSTVVDLSLPLGTGRGRRFTYRDLANSDDRGEFSFQVPYATGARQGEVEAAPGYVIRAAGREPGTVAVSDEQVRRGSTIRLAEPRPPSGATAGFTRPAAP